MVRIAAVGVCDVPCYHPLSAFRLADGSVSFVERGDVIRALFLPCGQCIGCRLERSRQWAVRCVHESKLHERNCFVTLTYDNAHLPDDFSLRYSDFQRFMKRLRKEAGKPVRFFMCGEYGEGLSRPHYHALLFGYDFEDKLYFKRAGESVLYTSRRLERLWPFGFSLIGDVSFESAAYCARYCVKKVNGKDADRHYVLLDKESGEVIGQRVPEFAHMSLKPGIGKGWYDRYKTEFYQHDRVIVRGAAAKPPRYYDKCARRDLPEFFDGVQMRREERGLRRGVENSDARLVVQEQVTAARLASYKRNSI